MRLDRRDAPASDAGRLKGRILCALAVLVLLIAAFAARSDPAAARDFTSPGEARSFKLAPGVHEFVFEASVGPSRFDRIALHRFTSGARPPAHPPIVMLYLPGTNMNGEAEDDDPRYSLKLYFAQHGVDLWALDYRTHFIPPQTPAEQLAELKDWTNELFESDIDAAARYIIAKTGRSRIFVSGFSRGASFAYLYASEHPERLQGLLVFDGLILDDRRGSPPPGVYASDVGGKHLTWDKRQTLLKMVIENPNGRAPLPEYKTASENLEHVVYYSAGFGGKGGLANPLGGFSNLDALARTLISYDRYWPIVQDYEDASGTEHAKALANSKIPVIAFSSTNIAPDWAERVTKSAASTGSSDVTVKRLAGWGHLDVICGSHAEQEVFAPAVQWLRQRQK
ncbi:MAG TPA: hypothetical protein VEF07_09355 [Candidatus Binataceae bacterium]|nr:hypothetical protein [Candidatus Binataceae bacterium]